MNKLTAIGLLLVAAIFEAVGDAVVRNALHQQARELRWLTYLGGAAILFSYRVIVNTPDWDFGRLLGLPPSASTIGGGALIVAGGVVIGIADA